MFFNFPMSVVWVQPNICGVAKHIAVDRLIVFECKLSLATHKLCPFRGKEPFAPPDPVWTVLRVQVIVVDGRQLPLQRTHFMVGEPLR